MDYILTHHGIKGQKWGVRRFQNPDGTRTNAGKKRYRDQVDKDHERIRRADQALSKMEANDSVMNRLKAGKAVHDLRKNKVEQARLNTYGSANDKKYKALEVGSRDDGWEHYNSYHVGPGKTTKALRKAHLMPKNEHGQFDKLKTTFDKDAKGISKDNLSYAKTKLSKIDKKSPNYVQVKKDVELAIRDYKAVKRGNKLRVGVSRPGLFPNMRADAIQNTYDNYKRRGYSNKDAAYAAFGNFAVKKFFMGAGAAGVYTT